MKKFIILAAILFAATYSFAEEEAGIVLNDDGNVGIGTDAPAEKLDVDGKIRIRMPTTDADPPDTASTKSYVDEQMNNTLELAIQSSVINCNWTGWHPSSVYCSYYTQQARGYLWQGYCVNGVLQNMRYIYTTIGCVYRSYSYYYTPYYSPSYGGP